MTVKMNREELTMFFSIVDLQMRGRYHQYYSQYGVKRGPNGNFQCWNKAGHANGDRNPSMSIDNNTGVYNCFGCGEKGNFQVYWKEHLKHTTVGNYVDFMADLLNLNISDLLARSGSSTRVTDDQVRNLRTVYDELTSKYEHCEGKPFMLSESMTTIVKETVALDPKELDRFVEILLESPNDLDYMKKTRNLSPEHIKKYRIGLYKNSFVFPMINGSGDLINLKLYDPRNPDDTFKWLFKHKGAGTCPSPMDSLTHHTITFFEGEPDTHCALSFGIEGAFTLGSKGATDVAKILGTDVAKRMLAGKQIVICLDSDDQSAGYAEKLAKSINQFDVKQIKIIDLDKSDTNPNGLDPSVMKTVTKKGVSKQKRNEKDFTDFMKKNGFGETAKDLFMKLVNDTHVYSLNVDRAPVETCRVTLQESRSPKYFSHDGTKRLEVTVTICDFDESSFLYDKVFSVSCVCMGEDGMVPFPNCKRCMLPSIPGFQTSNNIVIRFSRSGKTDPTNIVVSANDMLELIETSNSNKIIKQKTLANIDPTCKMCKITPGDQEKILHVRLAREMPRYGDVSGSYSGSDIQVDGYIIGVDVELGKSYKMQGIQTKDPVSQKAVLVIDSVEPIATSIDNFNMDQHTHEMLQVFRRKNGETIAEHFKRRYRVFGAEAGVTGRHEVFTLMDLAFFSQIEIDNKLFPSMKRGWVEILVAGESRSAKTMIARFLNNRYKIGDMLAGSSAVTRSGLIGGVKMFKGKPRIHWGALPTNDGGAVIFDELSNVAPEILFDMTSARSDGVVRIDTIEKGSAHARVRKIMCSNPHVDAKSDMKGVDMFMNICVQKQVLSRFDAAIYITADDVAEFEKEYTNNSTEFTEYQCRTLIMWTYSRKPSDVVYEDGLEEYLNECQEKLLTTYHRDTQLVNQEMRLKLLRMATSLAGMMYSTMDNHWDKLYVKKEHVEYIVSFLDKLYRSPNMRLDEYSRQKKNSENLGNMDFMENILRYVDVKNILAEDEFTQISIQQVFYDYLEKVQNKRLFMVDAKNDAEKSTGALVNLGTQKLIATLVSRNCLSRRKYSYRKTEPFTKWLEDRENADESQFSKILERSGKNEPNLEVVTFNGEPGAPCQPLKEWKAS